MIKAIESLVSKQLGVSDYPNERYPERSLPVFGGILAKLEQLEEIRHRRYNLLDCTDHSLSIILSIKLTSSRTSRGRKDSSNAALSESSCDSSQSSCAVESC